MFRDKDGKGIGMEKGNRWKRDTTGMEKRQGKKRDRDGKGTGMEKRYGWQGVRMEKRQGWKRGRDGKRVQMDFLRKTNKI